MLDANKIQRLITLNVEIEGLLHLLTQRDSQAAKESLKSHYQEFKSVFDEMLDSEEDNNNESEFMQEAEPVFSIPVELEDKETVKDSETEKDTDRDETPINQDTIKEEEAEESEVEDEMTATTDAIEREETISVDEMLARRSAVDLKRVFTLNDKFLFRRTLFNQDDGLFAQVLDELDSVSTYEEACELLAEQYGWNLESQEAKDFLAVIKPHYLR